MSEAGRIRVGAYALCRDDAARLLLCRLADWVGAGGLWILVEIVYRVLITGGAPRDEVDGSTDRCAWFSDEDLADVPLGLLVRRALDSSVALPTGSRTDGDT